MSWSLLVSLWGEPSSREVSISWVENVESGYLVAKILVNSFSVSLDGFGAGPDQSETNPWASAVDSCTSGFLRRRRVER